MLRTLGGIDGQRRQVLAAKSYDVPRGGASLSLSPTPFGRAILKAEHPPSDLARYKAPPGYEKFNSLRTPRPTT